MLGSSGKNINGLLFDLDGTLVNTHRANYEAYKAALLSVGVEINWPQFKSTLGLQSSTFLPLLAPHLNANELNLVRKVKAQEYRKWTHVTIPNTHLINFLSGFSKTQKTALVTTAQRESANMVLNHHGLIDYFDVIVTAQDVSKHKPSPEGYLTALRLLELKSDEVIAFEDSDPGIAAAQAASIAVIKVNIDYDEPS